MKDGTAENTEEKRPEDIFPDLKNGPLVEAMEAMKKNENPQTQSAFVARAMRASYFAPVDLLDENGKPIEGTGKIALSPDAKFNFRLIKNTDGESFFTLFTDITEFQKWNPEDKIKTIVVNFPQMANLCAKKADEVKGFVINPMGHNLIFTNEILAGLANHMNENAKRVKIMFGKPANIPDAVLNSLRKTLTKHADVKAVYFLMMKQDETERYLFVFDTDLEDEKAKKIAESFCASAKLFLTKYPIVSAPLDSPVGENAPKVTEPFYVREAKKS